LVWVLGPLKITKAASARKQMSVADERQEWGNVVKCHCILVHVFVNTVMYL
jgi:hypothetical protein